MKNILVNPKVLINEERKEVNDVIDQALIKWLIINSYNPIIISNKIRVISKRKVFRFFNSLNPKGIILSGGNDGSKKNPRYASQVLLINYATKNKIPILGICQGMQMMAVKYGSVLKKVKNHVRKKHRLRNLSKSKFPFIVNSYHNFAIKNCPKNFLVTTISHDGNIESIKHKRFHWEGWMWHPERDNKFNRINNIRLKKLFK